MELKAFPSPTPCNDDGMDLRDYFAVHIFQGFIAAKWTSDEDTKYALQKSYKLADLMLEERKKNKKGVTLK